MGTALRTSTMMISKDLALAGIEVRHAPQGLAASMKARSEHTFNTHERAGATRKAQTGKLFLEGKTN
jgi:hypothetical protein